MSGINKDGPAVRQHLPGLTHTHCYEQIGGADVDSNHSPKVVPIRRQKRLNVNINQQTEDALRRYCERHSVTTTEAIRRLINVGDYVLLVADHGGQWIVRRDGQSERVEFRL